MNQLQFEFIKKEFADFESEGDRQVYSSRVLVPYLFAQIETLLVEIEDLKKLIMEKKK